MIRTTTTVEAASELVRAIPSRVLGVQPVASTRHGQLFVGADDNLPPLLSFDEHHVYEGETGTGLPLTTCRHGRVYLGQLSIGTPFAVVRGHAVYAGGRADGGPVIRLTGGTEMDAAAAATFYLVLLWPPLEDQPGDWSGFDLES
ncbi:MAG: hypothetical protein ACQEXJ_14465 [Myxococcota bacterium]